MRTAFLRFILAFAGVLWLTVPVLAAGEVVDRILAVVNDELIAMSDVRKYQALFGQGNDPDSGLEELIDQKLLLAEAKKFQIPDPPNEAVEKAFQDWADRMGSPEALEERLDRLQLSKEEAREMFRSRLLVEQLLDQRVYFFILASPQEVEAYYQEHAEEFKDQSLEQVRSLIQDRLVRQKGEQKRKEYIDRLRSRALIRVNPTS